MPDSRAIGVFDSGLGGLTVVKELVNKLPQESIVYFGDTARVPYGPRSRDTIRKYARQDEEFLLKNDVKLIIAACGTVSSTASDIGEKLPVPYFEVVSHAALAAVKATKNKKIAIIGTAATVNSGKHAEIIKQNMPDAEITAVACTVFVPLVEEGWYSADDIIVTETVRRYLQPVIDNGCDTVILGCTHYPILSAAITKVLGEAVTLINAGIATADAVYDFLKKNDMFSFESSPEHRFFVSDKADSFKKQATILLGCDLNDSDVKQVEIGGL